MPLLTTLASPLLSTSHTSASLPLHPWLQERNKQVIFSIETKPENVADLPGSCGGLGFTLHHVNAQGELLV